MLYRFQTKNFGDVIMLQANGQRVVDIIGKYYAGQDNHNGILLPDEMDVALQALTLAISEDEAAHQVAIDHAIANDEPPPRTDAVSLRQRALPLMDMIRQCQIDHEPIVWGA